MRLPCQLALARCCNRPLAKLYQHQAKYDRALVQESQPRQASQDILAVTSPYISNFLRCWITLKVYYMQIRHSLPHRHTPRVMEAIVAQVENCDIFAEKKMADICNRREAVSADFQGVELGNSGEIFDACYEIVAQIDHLQRLELGKVADSCNCVRLKE